MDILDSLALFIRTMPSTLSQGVLWGIVALGVFITYKILDFPDLTVEGSGSLTLGGAVSAMLVGNGVNPFLALLISACAGMLAGSVTGFLHAKLRIVGLLAGILSMYGLYSVNLRIMGKPNVSLLRIGTVFTRIQAFFGMERLPIEWIWLALGLFISAILVTLAYFFFGTEIGQAIRATGDSPEMIRALGANTDSLKVLGLVISNGIIGLSGGLIAQQQGFADIQMGFGTIVIGLASVIIGEVFFGKFNFYMRFCGAFIGSIIYRMIVSFILDIQIGPLRVDPNDLKLVTAILVIIALAPPSIKTWLDKRKWKSVQK